MGSFCKGNHVHFRFIFRDNELKMNIAMFILGSVSAKKELKLNINHVHFKFILSSFFRAEVYEFCPFP